MKLWLARYLTWKKNQWKNCELGEVGCHVWFSSSLSSFLRINRQWVATFLLLIVAVVGMSQFVGDPIHCFTPTYFSSAQEAYAESYCWTASTYQMLKTKVRYFTQFTLNFADNVVSMNGAHEMIWRKPDMENIRVFWLRVIWFLFRLCTEEISGFAIFDRYSLLLFLPFPW